MDKLRSECTSTIWKLNDEENKIELEKLCDIKNSVNLESQRWKLKDK